MKWRVRPSSIHGDATVPGDKSISHRGLMLAAIARGPSRIVNLAPGADVGSTSECLRALGVRINQDGTSADVHGADLQPPGETLDAGNSGTTMRLLSGILAGQPFESTLTGDGSLRTRPMSRIVDPLEKMGAHVQSSDGHAPLNIRGGQLQGIEYQSSVPSAQVKSCVLLAALFASGETCFHESIRTRDHTERMMRRLGIHLVETGHLSLQGGQRPRPFELVVPGDFSSAAFLLAAAAITDSEISVHDVGLNPTRTAFLTVLRRMGCSIEVAEDSEAGHEPAGTVRLSSNGLNGIELGPREAPELLDELPLVALLGSVARGVTRVSGASELRVKESDRIAATVSELRKLGANIDSLPDGFVVRGPSLLRGASCHSHTDHRIAMMLALAGMVATGETVVDGVEAIDISYPGFATTMRMLGAQIDED